jgi:hypothetical protein
MNECIGQMRNTHGEKRSTSSPRRSRVDRVDEPLAAPLLHDADGIRQPVPGGNDGELRALTFASEVPSAAADDLHSRRKYRDTRERMLERLSEQPRVESRLEEEDRRHGKHLESVIRRRATNVEPSCAQRLYELHVHSAILRSARPWR